MLTSVADILVLSLLPSPPPGFWEAFGLLPLLGLTVQELVYVIRAKADDFIAGWKKAETGSASSSRRILSTVKWLQRGVQAAWGFIAITIVKKVGESAMAMADLTSKGQQLRQAFYNLANAAGESGDRILAALKRGLGGTLSNYKMIQEANRALISGLPAAAEKMEELATVARGMGRAVGIDAAEAFQRMVRGISKQEIELLDELFGGSVKFNDILRKLPRTANAAQKQMAIYNEILRVGKERIAAMGGITETFNGRLARAKANLENFREALGAKVIPIIEKFIPLVNAAADGLMRLFNVDELRGGEDAMRHRMLELSTEIAGAMKAMAEAREDSTRLWIEGELNRLLKEQLEIQKKLTAIEEARQKRRRQSERIFLKAFALQEGIGDRYKRPPVFRDAVSSIMYGGKAYGAKPNVRLNFTEEQKRLYRSIKGKDAPESYAPSQFHDPTAEEAMGKQFRETAKQAAKDLGQVASKGKKAFRKIPETMESGFHKSLARIEAAMARLGIRGGGFMGAGSAVATGLRGMGVGLSGSGFAADFVAGLETAGFAGTAAAGFMAAAEPFSRAIIGGITGLFGGKDSPLSHTSTGMSTTEQHKATFDSDVRRTRQILGYLQDYEKGLLGTETKNLYGVGAVTPANVSDLVAQWQRTLDEMLSGGSGGGAGGARTYSSLATLSAADGLQMVAGINTIVSELQHGHMKTMVGQLDQLIRSAGGTGLATSQTRDAQSVGL